MVGREIKLKSIIASSFQEVFLLKYINVEESAKKWQYNCSHEL